MFLPLNEYENIEDTNKNDDSVDVWMPRDDNDCDDACENDLKNADCLNSNDDDLEKVNDEHLYTFDIFDPRNWNVLDSKMINVLVEKGPKRDMSIKKGPKDKFNICFSAKWYNRILLNGEKCKRDWLVYCKEIDKLFCFCCKIF